MTPKPEELTGVTVGGEPLAVVLAREAEQRRKDEAEEVSTAEIREKRRIIIRHRGAGRMPPETSRVSKRVRHLTPDEIRKEYGVMQSPYASQIENVLHLIKTEGPVSARNISEILKLRPIRAQQVVSVLWRALERVGARVLHRELVGGQYVYSATPDFLTVESVYKKYLTAKVWKLRGKKPKTTPTKHPVDPNPTPWSAVLEETLERALGVKVEVSGQINIVFKFER